MTYLPTLGFNKMASSNEILVVLLVYALTSRLINSLVCLECNSRGEILVVGGFGSVLDRILGCPDGSLPYLRGYLEGIDQCLYPISICLRAICIYPGAILVGL